MKRDARQMTVIGQAGEFLVSAELARRGYFCTPFAKNVPKFDLITIDKNLQSLPIQVKTIRKSSPDFPGSAKTWMEVKFEGNVQNVRKKKLSDSNLIFVYVVLGENYGEDRFFILRKKESQNIHFKKYKSWLKKHGGVRPKNPKSLHCSIVPKDLEEYENNWALIGKEITPAK